MTISFILDLQENIYKNVKKAYIHGCGKWNWTGLLGKNANQMVQYFSVWLRLLISQDVGKMGGRFPSIFIFYTINEAHKQYSLLDKIFNYIFYLGPPGKYLYKNQENLLHIGRLRRPTCSKFWGLEYRYFPGGPK